ncbi:MAG: helix-turn-helix domain-containing protein [Akkermansia sp.]|nr:helix-turn-helix domain-containing protein [Akkermansia sp.]
MMTATPTRAPAGFCQDFITTPASCHLTASVISVTHACARNMCFLFPLFLQKNAPVNLTRWWGYDMMWGVEAKNEHEGLRVPRGITVAQAATALRYSTASIRRLIAQQVLVAWKPAGPRGRKWLIDEVSLSRLQAALIDRARSHAAPTQQALLQGELPLW